MRQWRVTLRDRELIRKTSKITTHHHIYMCEARLINPVSLAVKYIVDRWVDKSWTINLITPYIEGIYMRPYVARTRLTHSLRGPRATRHTHPFTIGARSHTQYVRGECINYSHHPCDAHRAACARSSSYIIWSRARPANAFGNGIKHRWWSQLQRKKNRTHTNPQANRAFSWVYCRFPRWTPRTTTHLLVCRQASMPRLSNFRTRSERARART